MLLSLIAFLFVLGVLVMLHEAGHFLAARALGAPVEVFSVGFGKRIWGISRGGTDYRISLIPFGGYVRVVGLGPDESTVTGGADPSDPQLPRLQRALILLAGPLTNLVAAVAFLGFAYVIGVETPRYLSEPPRVGWVDPQSPAASADILPGDTVRSVDGDAIKSWRDLDTAFLTAGGRTVPVVLERGDERVEVEVTPEKVTRYEFGYAGLYPPLGSEVVQLVPGSPAERAGLQPGDAIVSIDGTPVDQFWDLIRLIAPRAGEAITLGVVRDGRRMDLEVVPRDEGGEGKIGIALVFPTTMQRLGPGAAVAAGFRESVRMTRETFRVIGKLLTRKASIRQVSGPIDIARISGEAARSGLHTLVWFMGLISLQLGIFNLLPIPILDGGHLAIIAFESTIRRDLSMRVKERILEVGFYLLILLMVVVLFNDILKVLPESLYRLISRS
jgi:regulator of sigma E protease